MSYSNYKEDESTLNWQFLVRFQLVFVLQIQAFLVLGVTTFSNKRHWSFDIFSNRRFTLYLRKVGMPSPNTKWKHIRVSLQFKVFLYLQWEYHPIQGLPCIGLCLFPNTRRRYFVINGCPCIWFWLVYHVMSQYKKVKIFSNSR